MNPRDVAAVLGILTAAWPNQTLPEQTVTVWMDMLADLDPADAQQAARTLVKTEQWFPSIARFRNEAQAAAHARQNRRAATHGLPGHHRPAPPPPALVEAARALLDEQRTKKHWHGGPAPCPVCGGMAERTPA